MNADAPSFGGDVMSVPNSVSVMRVCSESGQQATQFCQQTVEEYFRKGAGGLPFCSIHSGTAGFGDGGAEIAANMPVLDAVPVRPKEPTLLGDDPYHTEVPSFAATSAEPGFVRRRTNVLDSLDLSDVEERIPLQRPKRLKIEDD